MKNKLFFTLLIALIILSGCTYKPANEHNHALSDTLAYRYETIKRRADDCGNKPDSGCTVFKLKYPIFKNRPNLNDTVKTRAVTLFQVNDSTITTLPKLMKFYFKAYEADLKDSKRKMFYEFDIDVTVMSQTAGLISLKTDAYTYQGGAHGQSFIGYLNWDVDLNRPMNLKDMVSAKNQPQLNKIAEKIFRKQEGLKPNESLTSGYFFKDSKFSLNNNFLLTRNGLLFEYNEYEIKPFAAGQTELLIPAIEIKPIALPNSKLMKITK